MAHFYGGVHGNRGPATRLGSKASGLQVFANGWDVGARIVLGHVNGHDVVRVYRTSGSSGHGRSTLIAEFVEGEEDEDARKCGISLDSLDKIDRDALFEKWEELDEEYLSALCPLDEEQNG